MLNYRTDPELYKEVAELGARDMEICMQCATCSGSCPLSSGTNTFPRKIYRYLQLGLRDKLLQSPEPWLCYYCGECNLDCPRGAEPAETMMAVRRWLTTQYDWTGLARRFYLSDAWELGTLIVLALGIIVLFVLGHGPIITDRVSVNTFAPVLWIEIGDLVMAAILTTFLMSNAFRMFRFIMADIEVPAALYLKEAKTFVLQFLTQKRWRKCGEDRSRWMKHLVLVSGYLTMMMLIIVFLRWFQVDDSSWHFTSIFGYYATAVLLVLTVEMFRSRFRKKETIHRFSETSDWLFLILLFLTTLTGIVMHIFRLSGWPMGTYVMYVIHLAIAVPMLIVEVPFGKWSHLFYRPMALFLTAVREKASKDSRVDVENVLAEVGETFMSCLQCGSCTAACPWNRVSAFSPRLILRQLSLGSGNAKSIDEAVWRCVTCHACEEDCPRAIEIIDVMRTVRQLNVDAKRVPESLKPPLISLKSDGNPWGGSRDKRTQWSRGCTVPEFRPGDDFCLFTCCTTAYEPGNPDAGPALPQLLKLAGTSFGTLGTGESCCGDPAHQMGDYPLYRDLMQSNLKLLKDCGVEKMLVTSPHCLNTFLKRYAGLQGRISIEHYTEFLDRCIADGRLIPAQEVACTVTYHDPCYLGRQNGIYQAPRRILKSIPGLELVEMENHMENSLCCGGGGGGAWRNNPATDRSFGMLRLEEALDTKAEVIATACPFCIRMLGDAVKQLGVEKRIVVRDIAELLLQSVEVKVEANPRENLSVDQEACHV